MSADSFQGLPDTPAPESVHEEVPTEQSQIQQDEPEQREAPLGSQENPLKGYTAFIVLIGEDGDAVAVPDINMHFELQRPPTAQDFWRGCQKVIKDCEISQISATVVSMLQQTALQAQAQFASMKQNTDLMDKLRKRGIRVDDIPGASGGVPLG